MTFGFILSGILSGLNGKRKIMKIIRLDEKAFIWYFVTNQSF